MSKTIALETSVELLWHHLQTDRTIARVCSYHGVVSENAQVSEYGICDRTKALLESFGSPFGREHLNQNSVNVDDNVRLAAEAIQAADALLITAGAGMGVDSGLPDFRGTQGFWRAYPAIAKLGLSFKQMANPAWFKEDPALAWAFYGHRLNLYRSATPHPGFSRLLEIGRSKPHGYFVFTSNVDGQFQKAGFSPERIVECHGSIHHFQCTAPCADDIWDANDASLRIEETFRALEPLPKCINCSALARPNILMFGDWSWLDHRAETQHRRFAQWLNKLANRSAKLAVIELGAGSAIPTVRHTSEQVAQRFGRLIRINPRDNSFPAGQIGLPLGAAEGIQQLWIAVGNL